jgi:hypothetical protein
MSAAMRRAILVAGIGLALCAISWLGWGVYVYWNDSKLVNFLASWIPFVLTVLIAFVPDQNMSPVRKFWWRAAVIVAGFGWSAVLWHQQVITEIAAQADQARIVTDANTHSDAQFDKVEKELASTKTDLGTRIVKVPSLLTQTESHLDASIGKVGIVPEKHAQLRFSFWTIKADELSTTEIALLPEFSGDYGVYIFDVTTTNISDTTAKDVDMWVNICDSCTFAEEPQGFDRPTGMPEQMRHKFFAQLNPGVTLEKIPLHINVRRKYRKFNISFSYSCATCGKLSQKDNTLTVISTASNGRFSSP